VLMVVGKRRLTCGASPPQEITPTALTRSDGQARAENAQRILFAFWSHGLSGRFCNYCINGHNSVCFAGDLVRAFENGSVTAVSLRLTKLTNFRIDCFRTSQTALCQRGAQSFRVY